MSAIISRTPFSEETSSLFADEKILSARTRIIEWLNETAIGDTTQKCEAIVKIQELMLNSCPELLEEFLENMLSFGHDFSFEVRKNTVGFIEQVCKTCIEFAPRVINILAMLLRDSSPQVIKRVIQACASVYRNTLQWLIGSTEISDNTEQAWNTLSLMKAQILDMIDSENDGIRTNAIKFLEGVVILQTYPDEDSMKRPNDLSLDDIPISLKIARRRKLEVEALNIFNALVKFHAASHISSVNLIACTGTLCTIAKMRPSLMTPVIEAIKNLQSNLPPTLTDSQVSSVRKHLKMQLMNLLKNRGSFEMQSTIVYLLQDLGCSASEITKAIPKMDKHEQQRRVKRALEVSAASSVNKRARSDKDPTPVDSRPMEIDYDEIEEQKSKCLTVNCKAIAESLKNIEQVVQLVMHSMNNLPNEAPEHFLSNYTPLVDMSISQQISKISGILSERFTEQKLGPGMSSFTKDLPMRPCVSLEEEKSIIQASRTVVDPIAAVVAAAMIQDDDEPDDFEEMNKTLEEDQNRKEEATKKLRETMERVKGENALLQRMKQRVKSLKLQEVTKPLPRSLKESCMVDSIKRILNAEHQCVVGGMSSKRRKILTVMAATFPDKVRDLVFDFITDDIKIRLDLAFSWLYEEYCLLQGFTRHSYIKTENKPDFAYNALMTKLIQGICKKTEFNDRIMLLRRVYLEAPILPEESIVMLIVMCELEDMSFFCLELIKDLVVRRPPRKQRFLKILLTYCVHENAIVRGRALENLIILYAEHKVLNAQIEEVALTWLSYLEQEKPPTAVFGIDYGRPEVVEPWNEDLSKICLTILLALLPYHEELIQKLSKVYTTASPDMKRTILRSIETSIRKMGSDSFELLKLIETCPKGVETLVTRIIYILTEKQSPTPELVNRVRQLYQTKVPDVRLLIPVLGGLTKKEILKALPKFLKLSPIVMKEVFNRLLRVGADFSNIHIAVTPTEVFVALHTMDTSKCELKFILKATSVCLAEKDVFTQDVLAVAIQQLIEIVPLPTLLMRTVIQSLTLFPRLAPFVVSILQRLILKQVWKQKVIWDGFLKCCQRLKPLSLPVLMQLPPQQLMESLDQCPDLRQPMIEYAEQITETEGGYVSQQVLDIVNGTCQDVFVTDETGGYILPENIKKEKEEHAEYKVIIGGSSTAAKIISTAPVSSSAGQPLPPGEE